MPTGRVHKTKDEQLSTHTNSVNAAVAPGRPATTVGLRWRMLGVVVAAALAVDAYVHFHDARFYDSAAPISQATLFRVEAVVAIVVAVALLVRPRPLVWALALLVTASAAAAVVLYTYVNSARSARWRTCTSRPGGSPASSHPPRSKQPVRCSQSSRCSDRLELARE